MLRLKTTLFLLSLIFLSFIPLKSFALEDGIMAIVNDEIITVKDLQDYIHSTYFALVAEGMQDQKLKEIMQDLEKNGLNKLIEDKLIVSKANQMGLQIRPKLVDERINNIRNKYNSEEEFVNALVESGATITDLKNKILEQLKIKYAIDHEVEGKIFINPAEVTEYYHQNLSQFQKGERVNLDSIYIAFGDNKPLTVEKAHEAYQLILGGKDFREVAKQYSQTPALGTIEKGQLMPAIEEKIFNLEPNEVSGVIEVDSGLYIFKSVEKLTPEVTPLNEVKDIIHTTLYRQKFHDRLLSWVDKLKTNAYIEIKQE